MTITVSGSSITFPDSTTQTTAFTGGGGVTSLNGQTGAITNTAKNAIGSYVLASVDTRNTPSTTYTFGSSTVSGTLLGAYIANTTYGYYSCFGAPTNTNQTICAQNLSNHTNLGLTGTWQAMGNSRNYSGSFSKDAGDTGVTFNFWVRIS